jgi:D-lactate dehydrogenase (cytochrome)
MAATRASGTNAVRDGTMRENTMAVSAVLANGEVLKLGSTVRKASNGYDLVRLFVGSEGTLGTLTKLSVRLQPRPESSAVAVIPFTSIAGAVSFAVAVLQCGLPVARMELFDSQTITALNKFLTLDQAFCHAQPTFWRLMDICSATTALRNLLLGSCEQSQSSPMRIWRQPAFLL